MKQIRDFKEVPQEDIEKLQSDGLFYSVYVLYKDGLVVYVGCSAYLDNRLKQHRHTKKDFDSYRVVYNNYSKSKALTVERVLIDFIKIHPELTVLNKQRPTFVMRDGIKTPPPVRAYNKTK